MYRANLASIDTHGRTAMVTLCQMRRAAWANHRGDVLVMWSSVRSSRWLASPMYDGRYYSEYRTSWQCNVCCSGSSRRMLQTGRNANYVMFLFSCFDRDHQVAGALAPDGQGTRPDLATERAVCIGCDLAGTLTVPGAPARCGSATDRASSRTVTGSDVMASGACAMDFRIRLGFRPAPQGQHFRL